MQAGTRPWDINKAASTWIFENQSHVLQPACRKCALMLFGLDVIDEDQEQNKKNSPKGAFSGWTSRRHSEIIRADVPGQELWAGPRNQELWAGPRNLGKTSIWLRTSMTPGIECTKLRAQKLRACFSFPRRGPGSKIIVRTLAPPKNLASESGKTRFLGKQGKCNSLLKRAAVV